MVLMVTASGLDTAPNSLARMQQERNSVYFDGFKVTTTVPFKEAAQVWRIANKIGLEKAVINIDKKAGNVQIMVKDEIASKLEDFINALPQKSAQNVVVSQLKYDSLITAAIIAKNAEKIH